MRAFTTFVLSALVVSCVAPPGESDASLAPPCPAVTRAHADRVADALRDLQTLPEGVRGFTRYVSLDSLVPGCAVDLPSASAAVSKALNSVSQSPTITPPVDVRGEGLLLRIDVRDYLADAGVAHWEVLSRAYPYHLTLAQSAELAALAETQLPIVDASWLVKTIMTPPFYHTLLGVPPTLGELEAQLGLDIQGNIEAGQVLRAGREDSGVSDFNRLIERHTIDDGYFYLSYDFAGSIGNRSICDHPLRFTSDGGEIIWSLPNGLQGYMLVDTAGNRLDVAPREIVQDETRPDREIINGQCGSCHHDGLIDYADQVLGCSNGANLSAADRAALEQAHQPQLTDLMANDRAQFRAALSAAEVPAVNEARAEAIGRTTRAYEVDVASDRFAGELGIAPARLGEARADPGFPVTLRPLFDGSAIPRGEIEQLFGEAACALGISTDEGCLEDARAVFCNLSAAAMRIRISAQDARGELQVTDFDAGPCTCSACEVVADGTGISVSIFDGQGEAVAETSLDFARRIDHALSLRPSESGLLVGVSPLDGRLCADLTADRLAELLGAPQCQTPDP